MLDPDFFIRCLPTASAVGIGASIGSFMNVCIYRIPIGLTITKPERSFCPSCRSQIKAIDNIPLVSWLVLKGRCRFCHSPIPVWYFLVELFAAIGAGIACQKSGLLGAALFLAVFSILIYALRTARAGYPSRRRLLILSIVLAGILYFQRGQIRWEDQWKFVLCCLGATFILRSGYTLSVGRWSKGAIVFSAALASGWLGTWAAAALLLSVKKRSPDAEDAILLACVIAGPILS